MATSTTTLQSDIKGVEFADLGKKRIEWANQSMKVLQIIRKEFIKNQPPHRRLPARHRRDGKPGHLPARWRR
jgi:hypothetical protein